MKGLGPSLNQDTIPAFCPMQSKGKQENSQLERTYDVRNSHSNSPTRPLDKNVCIYFLYNIKD